MLMRRKRSWKVAFIWMSVCAMGFTLAFLGAESGFALKVLLGIPIGAFVGLCVYLAPYGVL